MNTSKTLLAILVEYLPENGGWPHATTSIGQDWDRELMFYGRGCVRTGIILDDLAIDHRKRFDTGVKITREQYEAALAAKNEGWIEWSGGECPPVSTNTVVDVKFKNGNVQSGYPAGEYSWEHVWQDCNIIAYRLHKPQDANSRANDERLATDLVSVGLVEKPIDDVCRVEADLNDCIGQPQEDIKAIRAEMLEVLDGTGLEVKLRTAMKLVDAFIDAGYRKQ